MHAWLCENPVGVDALTWKELPTPSPKAGEVLIEIKAASLNFPDLLIVQNKYQMKPPLPFVPGSEYAGVVQAVGDGVSHLKVGQHVACLSGTGGGGTGSTVPAATGWFSIRGCRSLHHDLRHLVPRTGGPGATESG